MSKLPLVVLAALFLCGCENIPIGAPEDPNAPGCPSGTALAEAATVIKFRPGGGKDPTDVVFTGELAKPDVSCDFDPDDGEVDASFSFLVTARRGPAATNEPQTLTYFVAVVDLENNVVLKRTFAREITLDKLTASFSERPDSIRFKVPKEKRPVSYGVIVGFQLTSEELAYNRERRRYIP
ncbi:MAG: hypothetical protein ACT4OG_05585 [Alphaproteobacteria bacterium]